MTWRGVEPSKAGLGSFSQGPMASGETRFSKAPKSLLISVNRLAVDELGTEPLDHFEMALNEKPVMRVNASWDILYRLPSSLTEIGPEFP